MRLIHSVLFSVLALCGAVHASVPSHSGMVHNSRISFNNRDSWVTKGSTVYDKVDAAFLLTPQGQVSMSMYGKMESGLIVNQVPISPQQFEVILEFNVKGRTAKHAVGEGFVLALSESRDLNLGNMYGLDESTFKGLAIVFDSKDNDNIGNNPAVSAHLMLDGRAYKHDDDGVSDQLAGCIADYRNRDGPVRAKVVYNKADGQRLTVFMDLRGKDVYQRCLTAQNVDLSNSEYFLAIAAQNAKEGHDLHMLSNLNVFLPVGTAGNDEAPTEVATAEQELEGEDENPVELQAVDQVDHEFVNKLIESQATGVATLGSALNEVENNIIRILNHQFGMIDRALYGMVDREEKMSHGILQLRSMDVPKMQAAISDIARIAGQQQTTGSKGAAGGSSSESDSMKKMVDQLQKSLASHITSEVARAEARIVSKLQAQTSSGFGYWAFIALFQVLFACFIVWRQIVQRYRHEKLL